MKIIIASDSFKGSMTAKEVCTIIADAISNTISNTEITIKPMADGGEGTAQAIIDSVQGQWITEKTMGPLPDMQVDSAFAWFEKDKTAVVEMAIASGLQLLNESQKNPMKTTTFGTGQLIKAACKFNPEKILLAVGGSATVDGGFGAAKALDYKFLDKDGNDVPLGGQGLELINEIIKPQNLNLPKIEVLCDVDNPLTGQHGAAAIFSPQKGATPEMVKHLEKGLENLADKIQQYLNIDIKNVPGSGAAGGLSAGAMAFMNAAFVSGIEKVMEFTHLTSELPSADWIISGEGSFDSQSLRGKVISGIAKKAQESKTKMAVIAGKVSVPKEMYQQIGIETALTCAQKDMTTEYAIENCKKLLYKAAEKFAAENLLK